MTDPVSGYPPLPDLEIAASTKMYVDQMIVDRALSIVYATRPDIFRIIADRETQELDVVDISNEIVRILHSRKLASNEGNKFETANIVTEARRRARLMYGLPLIHY